MGKKPARDAPPTEATGLIAQLREAIRDSGESLQQLGKRTRIGADRLSRFVRGERGLSLEAADTLCRALGLSLSGGAAPAKPPAAARDGRPAPPPARRPAGRKGAAGGKGKKRKGE